MKTIFGREPAMFWGLVATLIQAALLLFPVSEEVHGALNAAVLAAAGLATAAMVQVDAVLPALTGLLKALFAVLLAYGTPLPESTQVAVLALVTALGAFFVRQQVIAKVPVKTPVVE